MVFLAVSLDEPKIENKTLREAFDTYKVHLPIVRDSEQTTARGVQPCKPIHGHSRRLRAGRDGSLQDYDQGVNPAMVEELSAKLEKLLAGQDLAKAWLSHYADGQKQFERQAEASFKNGEAGVKEIPLPKAEIAPKSEPKHLKLTSLWKCKDVKNPGNILVVPQAGGPPRLGGR